MHQLFPAFARASDCPGLPSFASISHSSKAILVLSPTSAYLSPGPPMSLFCPCPTCQNFPNPPSSLNHRRYFIIPTQTHSYPASLHTCPSNISSCRHITIIKNVACPRYSSPPTPLAISHLTSTEMGLISSAYPRVPIMLDFSHSLPLSFHSYYLQCLGSVFLSLALISCLSIINEFSYFKSFDAFPNWIYSSSTSPS